MSPQTVLSISYQAQQDDDPLVLFWLALALVIAPVVICFAKGKRVMALGGLLFVIPVVGLYFILIPLVGAIRIAKPDSWWTRHRYPPNGGKMQTAIARFEDGAQ
jgi:hypothetical protein